MARRPSPSQQIRGLLDELEPGVRVAFLEAIETLKSDVDLKGMISMLAGGNIEGALQAAGLQPAAYRPLSKAVDGVFESGAEQAAKRVPNLTSTNGPTAVFRFDIRNTGAEAQMRANSVNLVTNLLEDQRSAIRQILAQGIAGGISPRRTALDIVGRINPVTGRREGGLIGVSTPQAQYVNNMRQRLMSGDPEQLRIVLTMERRDKRFDPLIRKAIETGKAIDLTTVDKMTGRYADRLLLLRGETIARTETMTAFNRGQMAAMRQAINEGRVSADVVVKVWHSFMDERTRFTHRLLNKKTVGFDDYFVTARGARLLHPGDPNGGTAEVVCCRCWMETKIDFLADLD